MIDIAHPTLKRGANNRHYCPKQVFAMKAGCPPASAVSE
jgi:hypothetical protein